MNILLTGSEGYVGEIIKSHISGKHDLMCMDIEQKSHGQIICDLCDRDAVARLAKNIKPDIVIHAAGNKDLCYCENNAKAAFKINCETTKNVVQVFGDKAKVIYISTDYVFDGLNGRYAETDTPAPRTIYGQSKLCGEEEGIKYAKQPFIILRTSALYNIKAAFIRYLFKMLSNHESVSCFSNIRYSPTYYEDFLAILDKIISLTEQTSIFHSCGETTTRYGFALTFARVFDFDPKLIIEHKYDNESNLHLFPDLSLSNEWTGRHFNLVSTQAETALLKIKRGMRDENI